MGNELATEFYLLCWIFKKKSLRVDFFLNLKF